MSDSCTRPSGADHSCQCFHWWPHGTCWKWVNTLLPDQWAGSLFLMEAGSPADRNILNKFFGWSIPPDSHQWNPHHNHLVTQDCEHKKYKTTIYNYICCQTAKLLNLLIKPQHNNWRCICEPVCWSCDRWEDTLYSYLWLAWLFSKVWGNNAGQIMINK